MDWREQVEVLRVVVGWGRWSSAWRMSAWLGCPDRKVVLVLTAEPNAIKAAPTDILRMNHILSILRIPDRNRPRLQGVCSE